MIVGIAWSNLENDAAYIAVGTIVAYLHFRVDSRVKRVERKTDTIDRSVNNRPEDSPKLIELVEAMDTKLDEAKGLAAEANRKVDTHHTTVMHRFDGIDGRLEGIDDRVNAVDERVGKNDSRLDREVTRLDRRITEHARDTTPRKT